MGEMISLVTFSRKNVLTSNWLSAYFRVFLQDQQEQCILGGIWNSYL